MNNRKVVLMEVLKPHYNHKFYGTGDIISVEGSHKVKFLEQYGVAKEVERESLSKPKEVKPYGISLFREYKIQAKSIQTNAKLGV